MNADSGSNMARERIEQAAGYAPAVARIAVGAVFAWSGLLYLAGQHPQGDIASTLFFGFQPAEAHHAVGLIEVATGITLIFGVMPRLAYTLLALTGLGVIGVAWLAQDALYRADHPLLLSHAGLFLVQHAVLIIAAVGLTAPTVLPREAKESRSAAASRRRAHGSEDDAPRGVVPADEAPLPPPTDVPAPSPEPMRFPAASPMPVAMAATAPGSHEEHLPPPAGTDGASPGPADVRLPGNFIPAPSSEPLQSTHADPRSAEPASGPPGEYVAEIVAEGDDALGADVAVETMGADAPAAPHGVPLRRGALDGGPPIVDGDMTERKELDWVHLMGAPEAPEVEAEEPPSAPAHQSRWVEL